jgi:hypothetical protein
MINYLKKIIGLVKTDEEKWEENKSIGLEALLGKQYNIVGHNRLPFSNGGGLDLYYYPNGNGYAVATKELIDVYGNGPSNRDYMAYEFCMFSNVKFDLDVAKDETTEMGKSHNMINRVLNSLARYSFEAQLNPKETMEFPSDFGNGIGDICLIFDSYKKEDRGLMIQNKEFGLMVAIVVHRSEMEFAQQNGTGKLIELLKDNRIYPYSNLSRPPLA